MFRFAEDIETALGTEKRGRGENPAHLVALIEALDVDQLSAQSEIASCIATLDGFSSPTSRDAPEASAP